MNTQECQMPHTKDCFLMGYHFVPMRWTNKITVHITMCAHVQQVYCHIMFVRLHAKSVNAN